MKAIRIGAVNLRRLTRDRVGLFFVFVFPIVLILLIGVSFGGDFTPTLGVASQDRGPLSDELVDSLGSQRGIEVELFEDRAALEDAVERGVAQSGVIVPAGYDRALRSGETVEIAYVSRAGDLSSALRTAIESAVGSQAARVRAAQFASGQGTEDFDDAFERSSTLEGTIPSVTVTSRSVGDEETAAEGQFTAGASTQLLLFVFVNSLAGSVALIQVRRLGLSRRMLSTPTSPRAILLGEGLGRFLIAMVQALFIVIVARVLFDVNWGDPLGSGAVIVAFSLVATGAGMLAGAALANENQAGALTPVGLALAALGGCMVPLEVFSPTMQTIAKVTPHAWANEAFNELLANGGGLVDVLPQIGVLLGFAAVLLSLATMALRRSILT
ncbi:MAG TPA: ABC transporter permease [Actinomycetota bacterium]|nr:ABC transporter permease [Actinomycetota bacterium]